MSGQEFLRTVREHFTTQGWETELQQIQDGVSILHGRQSTTPEQGLALVITGPNSQVTPNHVKYLLKRRQNQEDEIDKTFIATTVGLSEKAQKATSNYDITVLDQSDLETSANTTTTNQPSKQVGGGEERPAASAADITAVLSENSVQQLLKQTNGIFAAVGLGFGLTAILWLRFMGDSLLGELVGLTFMFFVVLMMVFSGPLVGALAGIYIQRRIEQTRKAVITAVASGFTGYLTMTVVGGLLTYLFLPSSGSGGSESTADTGANGATETGGELFSLSDLFLPLLGLAIPVGVVAGTVVYVINRYSR
ncbi:hypothetical protein GS429_05970 [Natronorubrum sp. JWXQ-INN-674]|uniref:Uncharacterized protein n=1 Tax=Natronorubrum halalkaliphilum TaxID=2691917 RepID=A0A6B0VM16_9EURY|nr:hypothetical protein [Natronorubrum halalkaliphilum]MXV61619.1 hypothetical protein [Natronorubrum halalkaliphilum]